MPGAPHLQKIKGKSFSSKTDGRCHVCGIEIELNNFHADHVKAHIAGGLHPENNYCQVAAPVIIFVGITVQKKYKLFLSLADG
jgi:hypothetical protein